MQSVGNKIWRVEIQIKVDKEDLPKEFACSSIGLKSDLLLLKIFAFSYADN